MCGRAVILRDSGPLLMRPTASQGGTGGLRGSTGPFGRSEDLGHLDGVAGDRLSQAPAYGTVVAGVVAGVVDGVVVG